MADLLDYGSVDTIEPALGEPVRRSGPGAFSHLAALQGPRAGRAFRVVYTDRPRQPQLRWLPGFIAQVRAVAEEGVDVDTLKRLLDFVAGAFSESTLTPALVASSSGALQIEWHTRGIDFEILVPPTGPISFVGEDLETGQEWEGELPDHRATVREVIDRLS